MSRVDIKKTLAYQIALKLDKMDEGGKDSKINKSIWDKFAQEYNGKEINESMTLDQATKSITTYLIRKASELGTTAEKLAQEWLGKDSNEQSENIVNNRAFEIENNTVEQNPTIKGQDADFSKAKISPIKVESPFVDADEPIIEKVPLVKMEYENPIKTGQEEELSKASISPIKIESPFGEVDEPVIEKVPLEEMEYEKPTIEGQEADFSKAKISPIKIESPFGEVDEPIIEKVPLVKMEYEKPTIKSQEADLSNVKIEPQKIKSPFVPNYRIEENKKGETLYIYERKTGRKTIVNHGTEEVPALDISYNVGDAKVSVQSTIKLNEMGKVILDENGYAGAITIEKNGEKTVVPLEVGMLDFDMNLLPNGIRIGKDYHIDYNSKMKEVNTFIQTFTDNIFKDLSPEALDYFTKECDVLRFNLLDDSSEIIHGTFDAAGDANLRDVNLGDDNDEKPRRRLNRLSLNITNKNSATYTYEMQTSFLHELGHGVSSYHIIATGDYDLAQTSQTWADTFNDVYKYVQDNNLNSNGAFDYMLKPVDIPRSKYKSDPKQELFAEFFAYSMGTKADLNYSSLFETIKKNNPELFSKMTNSFNEILTEINSKDIFERKFATDAYSKYCEETILGKSAEPVKEPEVPPTGEYQYGKNFTNDFKQAYEEIMQNDQITSSQKEKLTKNKDHILNQIGYFAGRHVDSCSDMKNMIKTEGSVSAWISSYSSELQDYDIGSKECKSIISDVLKLLMEKYKNLQ